MMNPLWYLPHLHPRFRRPHQTQPLHIPLIQAPHEDRFLVIHLREVTLDDEVEGVHQDGNEVAGVEGDTAVIHPTRRIPDQIIVEVEGDHALDLHRKL